VAAVMQALSRFGVGASEIAAACGISRYRTRFGLWLEKTGRAPGFAGNVHTRLGQLCEPHIRQLYANARHDSIEIPPASMFHPEHPWARCTPDGIVLPHRTRLLQIKAMGYFTGRRLRFDGPPVEIEAQCQWEMFVTGAEEVDLAVLIGSDRLEWERFIVGEAVDAADLFAGAEFDVFPIRRDDAAIRALFDAGRKFWAMVEADEQPEIDHSDACRDFLVERAARTGVTISDAEVPAEVAAVRAAVVAAKAAEIEAARAKNAIRHAMTSRGADRIMTDDGPLMLLVDKNQKKSLRLPARWTNPEE
jgi:putative phage-type endonuclease